jgi:pimeloyl-ACP methyl ester carboxylesterase
MLKLTPVFTMLLAALSPLSVASPAFNSDFPSQVAHEVQSPTPLTSSQRGLITGIQYIFIDGTMGEIWKSNFGPAEKVLTSQWAGSESAIIRPYSPNTIPENAEILFQQIRDLRKNSSKKKAILIAHSKGATEVLLMALRHPELSTELGVVAYGLASGPFGGTDVIDYLSESCADWNPTCALLAKMLPSLRNFIPSIMRPLFAEALLKLSEEDRKVLEPQVFYVRTQMQNTDVTSTLYATHLYLTLAHPEEGPNDGLIPTANERLFEVAPNGQSTSEVFGTDLGIMIGDHNSLLNGAATNASLHYREGFFRSLVERMLFGE